MAARKSHAIKHALNGDRWRDRIRTSMLINRLQDHIDGKLEMKDTQVRAALGLLKKTAPDLSSVGIGQDENSGPLVIRWESD